MLKEKPTKLEIHEEGFDSFLICLALGTLYAIRDGALSPDAGIWSLGMPRVWEPFENSSMISREVIDVLQTCDELSAIQELAPEEFENAVTELIDRLLAELRESEANVWQVRWLFGDQSR